MLWNLSIENIAVAKHIDVELEGGFTAITGQTGAGKSIIIDCLLLLCGAKNAKELIRTGETKAYVTGVFSLDKDRAGILAETGYTPPFSDDGDNVEVVITRMISADGRSGAKLNNRSLPVSALREITPYLLGIQTQSERNQYADKNTYISLIDAFSDVDTGEYSAAYKKYISLKNEAEELSRAMSEREMMLDILKYQKKEIDSARLSSDDEEEKLFRLRTRLQSAEKVAKYSAVVQKALAFSEKGATAAYLLERASSALEMLAGSVEGAEEMAKRLAGYRYEIIDIAERVRDSFDGDELSDPAAKLTQVESRLSIIEKLEKKYGATIPEIKKKRDEISARIKELEEGDSRLEEMRDELKVLRADAEMKAAELTKRRTEGAGRFEEKVVSSLRYLDMPKVRLRAAVTQMRGKQGELVLKPDGCDDIDLLISVNAGEELQSLGKVSSGGELSRITLAIKTALAGKSGSETLVFDEIDAGVSGSTAEKIGLMLKSLSENAQVIAVTHSPQIASLASHHLLIEKGESDGRTESRVREITGEERVGEIARIIGGISVTEKQTAAAREMLAGN